MNALNGVQLDTFILKTIIEKELQKLAKIFGKNVTLRT